jgi:hypothetical protein
MSTNFQQTLFAISSVDPWKVSDSDDPFCYYTFYNAICQMFRGEPSDDLEEDPSDKGARLVAL